MKNLIFLKQIQIMKKIKMSKFQMTIKRIWVKKVLPKMQLNSTKKLQKRTNFQKMRNKKLKTKKIFKWIHLQNKQLIIS